MLGQTSLRAELQKGLGVLCRGHRLSLCRDSSVLPDSCSGAWERPGEAPSGGNRARELEKRAGLAWEEAEFWPRVRQLDPSPGLATAHPSLGSHGFLHFLSSFF